MRRRARPRPGDPGSNFTRWHEPTAPAEQEGPPVPPELEAERARRYFDGAVQFYPWDDAGHLASHDTKPGGTP